MSRIGQAGRSLGSWHRGSARSSRDIGGAPMLICASQGPFDRQPLAVCGAVDIPCAALHVPHYYYWYWSICSMQHHMYKHCLAARAVVFWTECAAHQERRWWIRLLVFRLTLL